MRPEIALPILIPLFFGALSLAVWRSRLAQRWLAVIGTGALLASGIWLLFATLNQGPLVTTLGDWQAPFGIVLVSDLLGAIMVLLAGLMAFSAAVYSLAAMGEGHERFGYYPLLHMLLAGVCGAFLTGDIFNLFVWFEVLLIASFALLILGGERAQMEGAIKYVTINLISSAVLLTAIGLVYGLVGSLNMADLAVKFADADAEHTGLITVIAMLFMISFGIKAAAFPLFFWLPASYHTPPVAVSALFAGLLTKVGVYALYRFFTLIFTQDAELIQTILIWGGTITMVVGVLGAAAHFEFRRILAFHSVSQIGYMILALGLMSPLAIAGGLIYTFHHSVVKTNLFFVSGVSYRLRGTHELKELGGLYRAAPWLSLLFLISALSLAGIPPLSGFFAKFVLVRGALDLQFWVVTGIALAVGLLTLFSMTKIWAEAFWKAAPENAPTPPPVEPGQPLYLMYLPIIGLAAIAVLMGIFGEAVFELAMLAAEQLEDSRIYIEAVLGENP
ncbi:Na+/H+ antiporter subunit D [Alkalilimnicola ehrlichii]|uniref:Na+/H+ antiporter subunit D n=1 Tax=Alkalilimnicola ehrlichii TaxID=351052 RepID=A0A3E0WY50_9GAMM|nr:Na+/H+ antiporter subunit D [Alkalilimnicola ehrlichii]RFA30362.1 Na+/H+ antiporter subunit D [Alkalilimnicola ehrlichii]RFA37934.1 Na+/H+ antiporter subunit D [Alkalilimnicola ehrlichii]